MKFKVGDKIKATSDSYLVTARSRKWEGEVISIEDENHFSARTTSVDGEGIDTSMLGLMGDKAFEEGAEFGGLNESHFEYIELPKKKEVQYLVRYAVASQGPFGNSTSSDVAEFSSMNEISPFLVELDKKKDVIRESIKVFRVQEEYNIMMHTVITGLPQRHLNKIEEVKKEKPSLMSLFKRDNGTTKENT